MTPVLAAMLVGTPLAITPIREAHFRERTPTISDSVRVERPRFDATPEIVISPPPPPPPIIQTSPRAPAFCVDRNGHLRPPLDCAN
jgi:hypothetical protein